MEYKLIKTTTVSKSGIALQTDDICVETIKSFNDEKEALNELKNYKLEITENDNDGIKYITEYIVEKITYDNNRKAKVREFIAGEVVDLSKLKTE